MQFSRIKCWDKWSFSSIKHTCVHIIFPKHQPKNKSAMVYARFEKPAQNIIDFNPQCQLAEPLLRVAQFHFPRCLWLVRKARNLWCFLLWNPKHTAVKVQRDFLQRTPHTHNEMCAGNWTQERKCHFQYSASEAQSLHREQSLLAYWGQRFYHKSIISRQQKSYICFDDCSNNFIHTKCII